jgi:endoglucanase
MLHASVFSSSRVLSSTRLADCGRQNHASSTCLHWAPFLAATRLHRIAVAFALLFTVMGGAWAQASDPSEAQSSPAFVRARHLKRGVNASDWFAQVYDKRGYSREHFQDWTTADDIALIKSAGFDHVRLSVNPQPMMTSGETNKIPSEYLGYLDAAVKMILDQGLAVVIDVHPDSDIKARLSKEDEVVEQFADFWRALAAHYSSWPGDRVFFEILNEPEISDRYRWMGIQAKLAAAIRVNAPLHTIIAAGARWSDNDDLIFQEPLHDSNVIYNFHFYEPHIFTHQGANWAVNSWHWLHGLPYPSDLQSAERAAALEPEEVNRLAVIRYGEEHWDAARIDSEIKAAADWAHRRGVPLLCDEFGAYRNYSNAKDREAWLHDVRTALEKYGIGWTLWDYSGSFGIATKANGKATLDEGVLRALGLK